MDRLQLHDELLKFLPNVYFQPPANITLKYPCIVYSKDDKLREYGNNDIYRMLQRWSVTVIDGNPDSTTADDIENYFIYCVVTQYYTVDNLHHTALKLFY